MSPLTLDGFDRRYALDMMADHVDPAIVAGFITDHAIDADELAQLNADEAAAYADALANLHAMCGAAITDAVRRYAA